ncbi:hypothetical protein RBB50_003111 [Rhinocladiella similis]
MAHRRKQQPKPVARRSLQSRPVEILRNGGIEPLEETPATSFLTLKLDPAKLARFPAASKAFNPCVKVEKNDNSSGRDDLKDQNVAPVSEEFALMASERSNPTTDAADEPGDPGEEPKSAGDGGPVELPAWAQQTALKGKSRLRLPAHYGEQLAKSKLIALEARKRLRKRASPNPPKKVKLNPVVQVVPAHKEPFDSTEELNGSQPASGDIDDDPHYLIPHPPSTFLRPYDADLLTDTSDVAIDNNMSEAPDKSGQRPQLKLKLSKPQVPQAGPQPPVQTPAPTSAIRTPSIKLKFGAPSASSANAPKPSPSGTAGVSTPASSSQKKRKRQSKAAADSEDELTGPPTKPKPAPIPKLTLKTPSVPAGPSKPATATTVKLKAKGKIPKRPIGVGYDSELEEKENDPMIHEGFILRMQPGPDCDYLRKAIEDGTVHLPRSKGGADVKMRMLDTLGRRGIMIIRGNQYAITMVDLPCIIEGMKSWDKKGWIKSIDVCQMLLVLGRCYTDEEARNYPLPEDVDPKNYQYAHGLTAPMKWVRKRRFARTKRTRVDDIESVERRVKALLDADKAASSVRYQLLDHDPRLDEERYSSGLGEEEDAEGEEEEEPDDYFALQNGHHAPAFETPMLTETPVEDIGQDEVDEFERMFADDDGPGPDVSAQSQTTLHPPEAGDSSFPVTSTSASPSATVAHTPASAVDQSSDDDDDEGGDEDGDLDDADKEGDDNLQQVKDRIEDMQQKIAEQTELLKKTQNAILKKKLARKIQDLKDDVAMMKKNAGLGGDEDDDD